MGIKTLGIWKRDHHSRTAIQGQTQNGLFFAHERRWEIICMVLAFGLLDDVWNGFVDLLAFMTD
jgi:hypothetical protein